MNTLKTTTIKLASNLEVQITETEVRTKDSKKRLYLLRIENPCRLETPFWVSNIEFITDKKGNIKISTEIETLIESTIRIRMEQLEQYCKLPIVEEREKAVKGNLSFGQFWIPKQLAYRNGFRLTDELEKWLKDTKFERFTEFKEYQNSYCVLRKYFVPKSWAWIEPQPNGTEVIYVPKDKLQWLISKQNQNQ